MSRTSAMRLSLVGLCGMFATVIAIDYPSFAAEGTARQAEVAAQADDSDLNRTASTKHQIVRELSVPTEVKFVDTPLQEVMEYMQDRHGISIIVQWNELREVDIVEEESINIWLSGVSFASALKILLEPLGLTYLIEDEVIKITTESAAAKRVETRVYDVRKLEAAGFDSKDLAEAIERTIRPETWRRVQIIPQDGKPVQTAMKRLSRAVSGRSKLETTDGTASVVPLPGCLVISQSQKGHDEIDDLLGQLEDVMLTEPPNPPAEVKSVPEDR